MISTDKNTLVWMLIAFMIFYSVLSFFIPMIKISNEISGTSILIGIGGLIFQLLRDGIKADRELEREERKADRDNFRDELIHDRALALEKEKQVQGLATTSHIANAIFDEQIDFCENYLKAVQKAINTLYEKGPCQEVMDHARNLASLREDYLLWLSPDMEQSLLPFENLLHKIGRDQALAQSLRGISQKASRRIKAIDDSFKNFEEILNINGVEISDPDATRQAVVRKIKDILQVDAITETRRNLVSKKPTNEENKE